MIRALDPADDGRLSVAVLAGRGCLADDLSPDHFVEPHVPNGKRASTVIAPQALYLMNNPFVAEQAKAFAASLPKGDEERVQAAYLRAFARPATAEEVSRALRFVGAFEASADRAKAWRAWCQVVFASSEFAYLN